MCLVAAQNQTMWHFADDWDPMFLEPQNTCLMVRLFVPPSPDFILHFEKTTSQQMRFFLE
jgi:hypothetical protein